MNAPFNPDQWRQIALREGRRQAVEDHLRRHSGPSEFEIPPEAPEEYRQAMERGWAEAKRVLERLCPND